jgi:ornithine cyclodeaminase
MIDFIGVSDILRLVERLGTGAFIERLAGEIEHDFRRWSEFEKSARLASHSAGGVIELMPTSDGRLYSFKYVNGHPKNTAAGLLTVTAFGVLADVATGYPVLLSELTVTTALRTAAMSALAARYLARGDARVMALIGIRELRLFDTDPRATAKLERNLRAMPELGDLRVRRASSSAAACEGADIVTTVTADKRNAVILTPPMIAPGMHLNAVGGDCPGKTELHPEVLRMRELNVFVEFEAQSRIEGEIQQMPADYPVTEFADLARGTAPGRTTRAQITVFDSVGFALEDFSAMRLLRELLNEERAEVRQIDLVPVLDNPKDLYGGTLGNASRARLRRTA